MIRVWLIFGAYDVRVFAALWVAMLIPISLLAAALSVLLSSWVSTRRAAVLVGLVLIPFVMILVTMAVPSFAGIGALIEPVYAIGILMMPGDEANAEIVSRMINTLALYGLVLAGAWTLTWLGTRQREAR